ncbi:LysR family transcriptional regulator [Pandoraea norimbergensis]|uniref:LysR family transcriptional regulator n=2 Tax=Pandoraea norimbergensis TaxID=93219 RepID=A0ABM5WL72_9BURK|nr:LysR family transcriptional regulator [Pandoraea norimbergensis]
MDLLHCMRTFVILADAGSFSRTAQRLDQTPSQVTRAISALEAHLGIRLLHRTTRSMALTEAGQRYLSRTRAVLDAVELSEREAQGAAHHPRGRLRVHCSASIANCFLIPLAEPFQRAYPDVRVDLTIAPRLPDLVRDQYDVALVVSAALPPSDLVGIDLGPIRSVFCASPEYVETYGLPRSPQDLVTHRCLQLVAPSYDDRLWRFSGEDDDPLAIDPVLTVDTAASLVIAAREGVGIALLPSFVVVDDLREGRLVPLLPQCASASVNLYLLYASRQHLDAKIRVWVDFMRDPIRQQLHASAGHSSNGAPNG